jgi:hypothetical protein
LRAAAGPIEFGREELERALVSRGLDPARFRLKTEISTDAPESYRIAPGLITGGDLRGVLYGLLEAADQIRETGRLRAVRGTPATPIRGARTYLHNADLERDWYYSRDYWRAYFAMLARNRFNRFNLVFAHQTDYLAPPYPFWVAVETFPEIRARRLTDAERNRNLEMLRFISQTAADHGIDFTLGVWEHNVQAGMQPSVAGITRANIGPYSYAALRNVLAACPAIRSVQMRTNSESGIPNDQQVEFYRDYVFRAIRDAGRRVVLDLRGWAMAGGMAEVAASAGMPLRLSTKYWAEDLGRPYQPAETFPGYSYLNFLEKPRAYEFYWEVWALGSHRLLLWGDPDYVRRMAPTFSLSGSKGFEIDVPLAQKGFGNRPGRWGVFERPELAWWKWEFERYWMFYLLWGRLSYDPNAAEHVWTGELKRRFGDAAPDVLEAYRAASGVLSEIVAAHLADPNMYIWPEINPGGLIDAYIDVRPSDWRFVASIPEAVRNRIEGTPSAKQTPEQTAAQLSELAARAERAVERARPKLADNREWRASEPDFLVLAHLARYHAHKQLAAVRLAGFYRTGDPEELASARRELEGGLAVWRSLVRLTDGLYPASMAFGPRDVGHWKEKLPYVEHDLATIRERESVLERFGRFDFAFDFGGPLPSPRGASYHNDPYVLRNTVEPRFEAVTPATKFSEEMGYGWITESEREAHAIAPTLFLEVRAVAPDPKNLPSGVLLRDWIRGRGAQTFRVRTGDGRFSVSFVHPDGSTRAADLSTQNGHLDIVFPQEEWAVSALVLSGPRSQLPLSERTEAKPLPRPRISHTVPKTAVAGRPLSLELQVLPGAASSVRLHYRALNQLTTFSTVELEKAPFTFTIPAEDISPRWDLMYYFELLNRENGGWFEPDPRAATPYYVVMVEAAAP